MIYNVISVLCDDDQLNSIVSDLIISGDKKQATLDFIYKNRESYLIQYVLKTIMDYDEENFDEFKEKSEIILKEYELAGNERRSIIYC